MFNAFIWLLSLFDQINVAFNQIKITFWTMNNDNKYYLESVLRSLNATQLKLNLGKYIPVLTMSCQISCELRKAITGGVILPYCPG